MVDDLRDQLGAEGEIEVQVADSITSDFISEDDTSIIDDDAPPGSDTADDAVPIDDAKAIGPARHLPLTIIAQDPSVRAESGEILRATVRVGADRFLPPFQTHRFNVISYDPRSGGPGPDLALMERGVFRDRFVEEPDATLLASDDFHAQNVFAIASRTLSAFEGALGRRIAWDFPSHQLYLVPHGEIRANAYYSGNKRALIFGVGQLADGSLRYSCLSHDVIAHETTHAILDGLRPSFINPSLPDQGGFHEGFADVVALLSVFSVPGVIDRALGRMDEKGLILPEAVSRDALMDSVLLKIAEEFGEAVHGRQGRALRESLKLPEGGWWRDDPELREVHNRGEILVAAVASALLDMWLERLAELLKPGSASRALAAQEGAKSAEHLLRMCIRAIDYCPPLEFEFEDFLDGLLKADEQIAPDDEHHYRDAVKAAFGRYDIGLPPQREVNINRLKIRPKYDRFNFAALRTDPDEVFRFIWENDELLAISLQFETHVESLRGATRVGPDGFVVQETLVTYHQRVDAPIGELQRLSEDPAMRYAGMDSKLELPPGLDPVRRLTMFGGGTIIFDQFGRPKLHFHKPLLDWKRQSARLKFLVEKAASESGRLGAAPLFERGEPLIALHQPDLFAAERW